MHQKIGLCGPKLLLNPTYQLAPAGEVEVSLVRKRGRWLVYIRTSLKEY